MSQALVQVITDLLDPPPVAVERTKQFKGVPHDEILFAYKYWLEYLKLLVKEPFAVEIIQGQQDEGVDLVINLLVSNTKLGLQVKSYDNISDQQFRQKVMQQISYSKKRKLSKLLVILCADLENRSHSYKVRNLLSQFSQMSDNYVMAIQPQQALPVYLCYKNKKHPLVYLRPSKKIIDLIQGVSESLSTDEYTATVSVTLNYKHDATKETHPYKFDIKFAPFDKDKEETPIEKLERYKKLGDRVEFTKDEIEEITIIHPDGKTESVKPDYLRLYPEYHTIGPFRIYVDDASPVIENVMFNQVKSDGTTTVFQTSEEMLPWTFEVISIKDKSVRLSFWFDPSRAGFKDAWNFVQLKLAMKKNAMVIIEQIEKEEKIRLPIDPESIPEVPDVILTMIENLAFIEDKLAQRIPMSPDISAYNLTLILEFASFLRAGRIEKTPIPITVGGNKKQIHAFLDILKSESPIKSYNLYVPQINVTLVGKKLPSGPVILHMHNVVLEGDVKELESKVVKMKEDEIIEFTFKSTGGEKDVYELVKSEADSVTDESTPFIREAEDI